MSPTPDPETLNAKALELLPELKDTLGDDTIPDEHLLKFLRWKPEVSRAAERFHAHQEWKSKNPGLFDESLRISQDPELERLLQSQVIVPSPSRTKAGGPLLIGRLRNNDMEDGRKVKDVCRMLFYTIDRVLEDPEAQLHGVTIVHDLTGLDKSRNMHVDIPKTVFGGILGHFPIRISRIYIYNAPWFFGTFFAVLSRVLLPRKVRERVEFVSDLAQVEKTIEKSHLPLDLGGETDFDILDWIEHHKRREKDGTLLSMTSL